MTYEDSVKEVNCKTTGITLSSKMTMQVMIVIVMSFQSVCSTARCVVTVAGAAYVPYTLLVVRLFIGTQNRLVTLHSVLFPRLTGRRTMVRAV